MSSRNPKYIQKYKWTIVSLYYLGKHIKKYGISPNKAFLYSSCQRKCIQLLLSTRWNTYSL